MKFMSNCPLTDDMSKKAKEILGDDNVLFAVVGDLKMDGTYGTSALVFGRDRVVAFDETYENGYITVDFEGLTVKIPEKYDEYLSYKYGDWRSELPESEQKSHHMAIKVDTNISYIKYISEIQKS